MKRKNRNKSNVATIIDEPKLRQTAYNIKEQLKIETIKTADQTYIEDTFEIGDEETGQPVIIHNEIKKKERIKKSKDELIESFAFKNKLKKIKTRVEYEKSFKFLFDYVESTKLYRSFYIDENEDEYDLLLYYTVLSFKQNLAKIELSYAIYQKIDNYFENLKNLYSQFNEADNSSKDALNKTLKEMIDLSAEVSYFFFK